MDGTIDWRSIIYRGIESEELDYKASVNWFKLSRAGKAKFARHCMALANTRGGYIVVGVAQDKSGRPCVYTGVGHQQAKTFDPTDVGNVINRYSDPPIDFEIERPIIDGKCYVIFVIRRFALIPHVCSCSCESELQQGVFYIRTPDASSRPAYKASEVHAIVQRALRNQREVLGRMLRGILYENKELFSPEAKNEFIEQIRHSKNVFDKLKQSFSKRHGFLFELSVFPLEFSLERFTFSQIKSAVSNALTSTLDSSFLSLQGDADSYLTNVAFRCISNEKCQFTQAFKSGLVHHLSIFPLENGRDLEFLRFVKLVSEIITFLGKYYYELGLAEEMLDIKMRLIGVEGVHLSDLEEANQPHAKSHFVCRIPEIDVKIQRSAADLMSGAAGHSAKLIDEICERFNIPDARLKNLKDQIELMQKSFPK